MSTEIVPLGESHADQASRMVAARYREGRDILPLLPAEYVHGEAVLPKVLDLVGSNAGVATVRGGELRGFLVGMQITWRGRPLAIPRATRPRTRAAFAACLRTAVYTP